MGAPKVGILMGSDSDLPVMQEAATLLEEFHIPFEITIVSAHRTPDRLASYAKEALSKGIKVIIAGAGGSAHLPGMTAAFSPLPVIGVPIKTKHMEGLDSLLSIVQMPPGIPVATVAINGAKNAGLLAVTILATSDEEMLKKLSDYKSKMTEAVLEKSQELEEKGFRGYGEKLKG